MSDINYKEFMESVNHLLETFDMNDCKNYILEIAKNTKPSKRMEIITSLESIKGYEEEDLVFQDDKLINDIQDLADRIDDCEFSYGYGWDSEYGGEREMGDESWAEEADELFERAANQVRSKEYMVAQKAYEMLCEILEKENLPCYGDTKSMLKIDFGEQAGLYLRTVYLNSKSKERTKAIYDALCRYFSFEAGKEVNIKAMIEAECDELPQFKDFLPQWIEYIKDKNEGFIGYLIREAVLIYSGTKGLLSFARENYEKFPATYRDLLLTLEKEGAEVQEIITVAQEGLDKINGDYVIREEVAQFLVKSANKIDNNDMISEGMKEAYYSKPSLKNILRLIQFERKRGKELNKIFDYAIVRAEQLHTQKNNCYWNGREELQKPYPSKELLNDLYLLSGKVEKAYQLCTAEKNTDINRWYGRDYLDFDLSFMFRLLSKNNMKYKANIDSLWDVNLEKVKKELYDTELFNFFTKELNEVIKTVNLDTASANKYETWCTKMISSTVEHIVSNQYRDEYGRAALLLVCCAEMLCNIRLKDKALNLIQVFRNKFPRHRNFIGSLNEVFNRSEL